MPSRQNAKERREQQQQIRSERGSALETVNGAIQFIGDKYQEISQKIHDAIPEQISGPLDFVADPVYNTATELYSKTPMGMADEGAAQLGQNVANTTGNQNLGALTGLVVGMLVPGPGELKATKGTLRLTRPDVTGMRNADARAVLGDFVTDPEVVSARPSKRLESDPYYKATQKGFREPTRETPMSKLPNVASPHHIIDVKGSIPYFEGSTPAAAAQRRAQMAEGGMFPGNDSRNYVGLFDGVLSSKAGKKTGIFSDDHNLVHQYMEQVRERYGIKTTGTSKEALETSKMISNAPEELKTALLMQISLRDELNLDKVINRRMKLAHQAFPDLSYNEFKDILLNDPKRFANLYKTAEGNLASYIHPEYTP